MRIFDIFSICFRSLTRHRLRTALTALGVLIGVCAILIMVSIGIGLSKSVDEQLASWGDLKLIQVYNWNSGSDGSGKTMDDAMVAQIQAMDGVDIATPFYQVWDPSFSFKTKNGRYEANANIYGVYPEALEKMGYALEEGTFLEGSTKEYSMVVGSQFAYRFRDTKKQRNNRVDPYPDATGKIKDPFVDVRKDKMIFFARTQKYDSQGNPTGKDLEVTPYIAGVLKQDDARWEATNSVFMDINELKSLVKKYNKLNGITKNDKVSYEEVRVICNDVDAVAAVQKQIEDLGFDCYSMESNRQYMQDQVAMIQAVLGGLAAISLFVAAIGIANTMVMSVIERTREIGIMKVIGARVGNIRAMFLIEAGMIGFLGGVVGVILSFVGSYFLNNAASELMGIATGSKLSIIPPWLVLFALVFSIMIGIIFGFLPANRAVKISALEAIKHD